MMRTTAINCSVGVRRWAAVAHTHPSHHVDGGVVARTFAASTPTTTTGTSSSWEQVSAGGRAELLQPIKISSAETHAFFKACRTQYLENGWCHIPNFLPTHTCTTLRTEAETLLADDAVAFASFDNHTVYQEESDSTFASDHPRNKLMQSSKRIVVRYYPLRYVGCTQMCTQSKPTLDSRHYHR
jgi:hypothetical protein